MAKGTTPKDIDQAISRMKAREQKYGLTQGQRSQLATCYTWLEQYYAIERTTRVPVYTPDRAKFNNYIEWRRGNPSGTYADYRQAQGK